VKRPPTIRLSDKTRVEERGAESSGSFVVRVVIGMKDPKAKSEKWQE